MCQMVKEVWPCWRMTKVNILKEHKKVYRFSRKEKQHKDYNIGLIIRKEQPNPW